MRIPVATVVAVLFAAPPAFATDTQGTGVEPELSEADTTLSEADIALSEIVITATRQAAMSQPDPQPWAHSQVSREGVSILGGPAQSNSYRLLDLMPSVNVESSDAYGLNTRGGRKLSLRGKGDFHLTRNIEGVPLYGVVGNNDLFDLENVSAFELYRAGMPANAGLGVSNSTGALDMSLRRPEEDSGLEMSQGLGSDNFQRSFARIDSGRFGPLDSTFFLSASDMQADKWKGAGEAPGARRNITFGLSQPFADGARFELFVASNHIEGNDYRAMNYAQTRDKSNWDDFDYDEKLNANRPARYYDFNRNEFDDIGVIANLVLPVGESGRFSFRPYGWDNDGYFLFSPSDTTVRRWDIEHKQKGLVAQYDHRFSPALDLTVGYWWMDMESPPPPVYQKNYSAQTDGSLTFASWALLSKQGKHKFNSPFLQLTGRSGAATISAGVRLQLQAQPALSYYATSGLPDVSYGSVWASNPRLDPWMQVSGKTYREWLPNLSLRYELRPELALTMAYGRRIGRPDLGPVASTYGGNEAKFIAQNVTLQEVFDGLQPEISDNFDLGLRYEGERLSLAPNLYYARTRNKEVSIYDPGVDVSYYQSVAKAIGYGVELEGDYRFDGQLSAIFALSYNRFAFDGDIQARAGTVTGTDGKQAPNAPRVLAKLGIDWRSGYWNVSPVARYVGKRYGDILNEEKVDGYFVADLHVGYRWKNVAMLQEFGISLSVLNVFDKQYIGQISASDFDLNAGSTYYAGAPRTAVLTLSEKF